MINNLNTGAKNEPLPSQRHLCPSAKLTQSINDFYGQSRRQFTVCNRLQTSETTQCRITLNPNTLKLLVKSSELAILSY